MNGADYDTEVLPLNLLGTELRTVDQLIELIRSQLKMKRTPVSRVFSPQGIHLHDDDVIYLRNGDMLYYDYKGKNFDPRQVVD